MAGPIAATIAARSAPSSSMARIVASVTPFRAPFHPAWAIPMTRARPSTKMTGAQSAVRAPSAMPRSLVTIASARGALSRRQGSETVITLGLCSWYRVSSLSASTPIEAATSARLRATVSRSSPDPKPQLRELNRPWDVPPSRVKKPCVTPAISFNNPAWIMISTGERMGTTKVRRHGGQDLEELPHFTRPGNPFHGAGQLALLAVGGFRGEDSGAELKPHLLQKGTLGHEGQNPGACASNGICKRLEVDMGGKIGLARPVENGNLLVAAHALEG